MLVVEDDRSPPRRTPLRRPGRRLRGRGHRAHRAEAVAALRDARERRRGRIDLILLDVNLPDTTGIELCRSLRAAGIEIDVIAVTAVRDAAVVRSAVSLGIVQYLIKPFGFAAFAEKLGAYRDYHARVGTAVVTDQQEVDASFAAPHLVGRRPAQGPHRARPSTACAPRCARRRGRAVGRRARRRLDLSRVTARRYLEHLADTGAVERANRYGAPAAPRWSTAPLGGVGIRSADRLPHRAAASAG